MKFYSYLVVILFLFGACSENNKMGQETEESNCGNDILFTSILKYSDDVETKSVEIDGFPFYKQEGETWDNGYVNDESAGVPVDYYPGNTLFLIAEQENGTRIGSLKFDVNSQVRGSRYEQSLTMRFYLRDKEPNVICIQSIGPDDDPTVDNSDKTMRLDFSSNGSPIRLYFSSKKDNITTLSETVEIGGETLFKPAGDDYFRSEFRMIKIEGGKMMLTDFGTTDSYLEICKTDDLFMELNRCTAILSPVLVVTEDRSSDNQAEFNLTQDAFEKVAGDLSSWKVRYYAHYPIKYRMYSSYNSNAIGNCIVDEEGSVANVALSNVGVETVFEATGYNAGYSETGGQSIKYDGFGGGDASYPFVFWADGERLQDANAAIYAVITHNDISKKLKVSLANTPITNNNHERVYVIIGISDLMKGFSENNTLKSSDGEEILDIPYKVFVKSNPL